MRAHRAAEWQGQESAGPLEARRLDLAGGALTGDPVTLADRVGVDANARGGYAV